MRLIKIIVMEYRYYSVKPQAFVQLASEIWPSAKFQPTMTHAFIKLLAEKKKLLRNYTQNIDGLETAAGVSEDLMVECHGHFRTGRCIVCKTVADMDAVRDKIWQQEVPKCKKCDGFVKPDIVFFGEQLPLIFHRKLPLDLKATDCCLIIGTSLQVPPVAYIPEQVQCPRILLNMEKVGDIGQKRGDLFHKGPCDDTVVKLAEHLGWDKELFELYEGARKSPENNKEDKKEENIQSNKAN